MIKEQTRIDELAIEIANEFENHRESGWRFIIKLRDAVDQFSRLDTRRMELYEKVSLQINRSVKTLQNKVSVARKPYSQLAYDSGLEFAHLLAVYHLDDEHATALLIEAYENGLDPAELGYIAKQRYEFAPENGNSKTPTADAIDDMLTNEKTPWESDADPAAGPAWNDDFLTIPREPVAAAQVIRAQFDDGEIAALIDALLR